MKLAELKAIMVANEINLNAIAGHFGIQKKFKWEDTLYLDNKQLAGVLKEVEDKRVYIFYFGSIVFVNMAFHEIKDVLNYLKKLDKSITLSSKLEIVEEYRLEVSDKKEYNVDNKVLTIPEDKNFYYEIASTVLARSVAMEIIEIDIDAVFDMVEEVIEKLKTGKLDVSDKQLASLSARILTFKYNTISYIMLLDKPDIVWENEDAGKVFSDLSELFETTERYETVRVKTETLMDITEMFSGLVHAKRGTRLEVIIIILFILEILMSLLFEIMRGWK
jgi:uncharacterized Rmd1/YagE family protein